MAGVTVRVPPVVDMVLLLPSDPVTVTAVALAAATVNVDDAPAATVVGLAAIVTVGAVVVGVPAPTVPHPVITKSNDRVIARGIRIVRSGRETRTFITVFVLPSMFMRAKRAQIQIVKTTVMQRGRIGRGHRALWRSSMLP